MSDIPILRIPCLATLAAVGLAAHLVENDIDGVTVEERDVCIPTDSPAFAWEVAEIAVDKGWADDTAVAKAVSGFLEGPDGLVTTARRTTRTGR